MNFRNVWIATQLKILIAHNIQKVSYLKDAMSNQMLLLVTPASLVSIILHLSPTNWNGNSGKVLHFISSRKRLHVIKRLHVGNYLTCNIVLTIPRVFFTIRWTNLPWLLNRFRWRRSTLMREWYCGTKLYILWKRKWYKRVQQWCELISHSDSYHINCYLQLQNNKY